MTIFILLGTLLVLLSLAVLLYPLLTVRCDNPLPARFSAALIFLVLPLMASLVYALVGTPNLLDTKTLDALAASDGDAREAPTRTPTQESSLKPEASPEFVESMVKRLEDKLKKNPDDTAGWLMMARTYSTWGRKAEAVAAYKKGETAIGDDVDALLNYAETLATLESSNGRPAGYRGKPQSLIDKALKLQPDHPGALFFAGLAAVESGRHAEGARYWQKLLSMVPSGSDMEGILKKGIANAREQAAKRPQ